MSGPDLRDFRINVGLALLEFGNAGTGIHFGPVDNLLEQSNHCHQARFRADEAALTKALQLFDRAFRRRRQVVMRLVVALGIVFAQPAAVVGCLIVEIRRGRLRIQILARHLVQMKQVVVELGNQFLADEGADVRRDKTSIQETGDHRRVIGSKKALGRMRATLCGELLVVHFRLPVG
jgi:hypothetical protein